MNEKIRAKLAALTKLYEQSLPKKIQEIEYYWHEITQQPSAQLFNDFHRIIHSLSGSAGTYGYPALSRACYDLDIYLRQLNSQQELDEIKKREITHLIALIKIATNEKTTTEEEKNLIYDPVDSKLICYFIYKKEKAHKELSEHLKHLGYQVLFVNSLKKYQGILKEAYPAVIVLEEHHLYDDLTIELLNQRPPQIPLVCLARKDNLSIRLQAIKANVTYFMKKPIDIFHLNNKLTQLCDLSTRENYRILILDDSELLASYYASILEAAGMNVHVITSPHKLLLELQDFQPNLLLLDLYLPECTGYDIAKIIRQEESYVGLPIIFISAEQDRIKQLSILNSCGGDDFLTKPVLPQNLIAAVRSRAQRSALLNDYIALDNLTKLLNHSYILKQLGFEIVRAERLGQPISVAMIDLDYFKQINDNYGHPVGDLTLKKLADLFSIRIRKSDFVGRYGGEEFAIIFPNTSPKMAYKLCLNLCKKIAQSPFHIHGHVFNITLSIGIAHFPQFKTAERLVAAADQALYKAKSNGRNRVEVETNSQ